MQGQRYSPSGTHPVQETKVLRHLVQSFARRICSPSYGPDRVGERREAGAASGEGGGGLAGAGGKRGIGGMGRKGDDGIGGGAGWGDDRARQSHYAVRFSVVACIPRRRRWAQLEPWAV